MDFVSQNGYRESNCIDISHQIGNHAHSFYIIAVTIDRWSWRTKFTKNESNLNRNPNEWTYLKYRIAFALFLCVPIWKIQRLLKFICIYCNKKKERQRQQVVVSVFPVILTAFQVYSHSKPLNSFIKKAKLITYANSVQLELNTTGFKWTKHYSTLDLFTLLNATVNANFANSIPMTTNKNTNSWYVKNRKGFYQFVNKCNIRFYWPV